ncbi:hypothetical protein CRYUN_Cryun23aG0168300 [Craigia yunnanensis]
MEVPNLCMIFNNGCQQPSRRAATSTTIFKVGHQPFTKFEPNFDNLYNFDNLHICCTLSMFSMHIVNSEDEQCLLVYEFMPRGSLKNHLFKRILISLPWGTRLNIAIGAAKGLTFLHGAENPVIYRDFKISNILLNFDFTAKLSDFGLAKMGPEGSNTHVTIAAPEYVSSGYDIL